MVIYGDIKLISFIIIWWFNGDINWHNQIRSSYAANPGAAPVAQDTSCGFRANNSSTSAERWVLNSVKVG